MMKFKYVKASGRETAEADVKSFNGDHAQGTDLATGKPVSLVWDGYRWSEAPR